jgi:hypothetical protein
MDANFKIYRDGELVEEAGRINWVLPMNKDGVGKQLQSAPAAGYSLVTNLEVPNIANIDLSNVKASQIKSTWGLMTQPIEEVLTETREVIEFISAGQTWRVECKVNYDEKPKGFPFGE